MMNILIWWIDMANEYFDIMNWYNKYFDMMNILYNEYFDIINWYNEYQWLTFPSRKRPWRATVFGDGGGGYGRRPLPVTEGGGGGAGRSGGRQVLLL